MSDADRLTGGSAEDRAAIMAQFHAYLAANANYDDAALRGIFSDAPDTVKGGNCYACHQMAKSELAFGTLGPSLKEYGKSRDFSPDAARAANASTSMPREKLSPCPNRTAARSDGSWLYW